MKNENGRMTSFGSHVWEALEKAQSQSFVGESIVEGMSVKDIKTILRISKKRHLECIKIIDGILSSTNKQIKE